MVQKDDSGGPKRGRGRPRAYEPEHALARARETFWRNGYSGTTLDDLSVATGMNRPSLYGAFGDKHALYLETLRGYVDASRRAMEQALAEDRPLAEALSHIYELALGMYLREDRPALGCFLIGTAAVEAVNDDAVRAILNDALRVFDGCFETRFERARAQGEIGAQADPALLAVMASAVLHTLALRARAGEAREALQAIAQAGTAMICGAAVAGAAGAAGAPGAAGGKHGKEGKQGKGSPVRTRRGRP
ncbi:TetR/AcrR family transcriptional regulator [Trinickia caryophylli]|uniref:Transcriptional regulator, TetR family n=1 Tax=Trinickia caryophylli TaxID=28094 RepID=A0A1X7E816_TRICW|nr:TetR/AcrR family transcriptional regulator [Trinickia caryophylli]PMS13069.1 TetR/AcrR family transcriptional regulator [Trinickia caryophylli]TRX14834.1 TetR/AcrR family transcriptional regulator [Trinickia caryophylli]WQE14684.1 TetR/AcrR family transcriptional regulator [Trinickia caryophylli]SMF28600.1 transcriptional regulator, TetR family [Trinickia caryophylli]GLU31891.1 TetR family transcriptional regulator [Trinickia caryophylli]